MPRTTNYIEVKPVGLTRDELYDMTFAQLGYDHRRTPSGSRIERVVLLTSVNDPVGPERFTGFGVLVTPGTLGYSDLYRCGDSYHVMNDVIRQLEG